MEAARAVWFAGPGQAEIRDESLPRSGRARSWSGPSARRSATAPRCWSTVARCRPTRRLTCRRWPAASASRSSTATPASGRCWRSAPRSRRSQPGDRVFCLHPHQTAYVVPADLAWRLPDGLDPERGVFAANVETALNVLLDTPVRLGERVAGVRAGDGGAADRAAGAAERGRAGRGRRSVRAAAGAGARPGRGRGARSDGRHARRRSPRCWAAGRTSCTRRAAARPRSRRPSRPSPTRAR